ncbi:MAG TPA: tetratricopeptide repeat protein [Oculatellaceae cyanobacterium]
MKTTSKKLSLASVLLTCAIAPGWAQSSMPPNTQWGPSGQQWNAPIQQWNGGGGQAPYAGSSPWNYGAAQPYPNGGQPTYRNTSQPPYPQSNQPAYSGGAPTYAAPGQWYYPSAPSGGGGGYGANTPAPYQGAPQQNFYGVPPAYAPLPAAPPTATSSGAKFWQIPAEPIAIPQNAANDAKVLAILTKARPLVEGKDYKQAEPMLLEAVAMDPSNYSMNTHNYLGLIYENEDRVDESISEYQKMLSYDPKSNLGMQDLSNAYCRKAKTLNENGQTQEALGLLQEAIKLNPHHAMFHNNLGSALQTLGELEPAIKEYAEALSIDPQMEIATLNIAKCYLNLGEFEQARMYFNKFIQEHPDSPKVAEARERLRYAQSKNGQIEGNKNGPDYFRETTATAALRWPIELMPIRVYIDWNPRVDGIRPLYAQALIQAFSDWCQATNYKITWLQVNSPAEANIICSFANDNSLFKNRESDSHEQGEVSGYVTFVRNGQKFVRHCNLAISTRNPITGKYLSDGEVHNVALHETGHTLGLLGHSPNYHDIMYFITNPGGGGALRGLSARDGATINILYANYPPRGTAFRQ